MENETASNLPPVWPKWVLEEIEKHPNYKFEYNKSKEPLLAPELASKYGRYKVRPIHYQKIYELFKKGEASNWTAEENDLTQDLLDWNTKLTTPQKQYLKNVLIYFLSSDSGVGENALTKFGKIFVPWEIREFYCWQAFNETVHSESYAMMVETFITDEKELHEAFNAIENDKAVNAKAELMIKWIEDDDVSPHESIVAMGFGEGVLFAGSFTSIGWIKQYLQIMPGLTYFNDLISRDEGSHTKMSFMVYRLFQEKLPAWRVYQICASFVEKEFVFIEQTLKLDLIGMNSNMLKQYILYVADITLRYFGYEPIYNVKNPFPWMENWSVDGLTSFFEKKNAEYQQSGVLDRLNKRKNKHDEDEDLQDFNINHPMFKIPKFTQ
jgi:ribonucleotide reductase beta subunit family protein with ferritin-like domain